MAIKTLDSAPESTPSKLTFDASSGDRIQLPSEGFIADAAISRDGDDLLLQAPSGEVAVIKNYYSVEEAPLLQSPNGTTLTPQLVDSFAGSSNQYAAGNTASDESPVGAAEEVKGSASVTRTDGTTETITIGTPIYQGDVIQTEADGAVNIRFMDETSMAVSQNARMSVDNYSFDAKTESGETDFSVLRGVFVFTSGLIGRDDPDDVHITTPVGSIGIRGTIIAGDINPSGESSITVLEGAIVVTNSQSETTLSKQFETVHLQGFDTPMQEMGVVSAADINARFESVSYVVPTLFSTIEDSVKEQTNSEPESSDVPIETQSEEESVEQETKQQDEAPVQTEPAAPEAEQLMMQDQSRSDILDTNLPSNDETGITRSMGLNIPAAETRTGETTAATDSGRVGPSANTGSAAPTISHTDVSTPQPVVRTSETGTNTVSPLTFSSTGLDISYTAGNGTALGLLTSNASYQADVTYSFSTGNTSPDGHFILTRDGAGNTTLSLATLGADELNASLDAVSLESLIITATHSDGRTVTHTYSASVTDDNPALNLDNLSSAGVTVISDNISNEIGYSIAALGDTNGDGFDDFGFTNNNGLQNHVYIVKGGTASLTDGMVTAQQSALRLTVETFIMANGGETVLSGAGDYNGDGQLDYVIGQGSASIGGNGTGNAVIKSSGGSVTGETTFSYNVSAISSGFGSSVAGVGDYNNDGYSDVAIGAPNRSSNTGRVMLMKGNIAWDDPNLLSGGTYTSIVDGPASGDLFGSAVAGIGDMNGDGYSDFAIGMSGSNGGDGGVKLMYGAKIGMGISSTINGRAQDVGLGEELRGLGDINGDGLSDLLIGSSIDQATIALSNTTVPSSPIKRYIDLENSDYTITGGGAAGDFNGDGFDDMTISLADANGTKIYVVYGKENFSGFSNIAYLKNPDNAFEMSYTGANASHDLEISGIGDINGDGYDDIAIGNPAGDSGNGSVIIVNGRNTGSSSDVMTATFLEEAIVGTAGADTMSDGGQFGVVMRGGAGSDTFLISSGDFRRIDGGSQSAGGYDTLRFTAAGGDLDFRDFNFEHIQGIERLQYGTAGQTMTLSVENLFNLMKTSDTGFLKIDSDYAGILNIDAGTVGAAGINDRISEALNQMGNGANHMTTDASYSHFKIGGYDLYIDVDLTVAVT